MRHATLVFVLTNGIYLLAIRDYACTGRCLQRLDLSDNPMTSEVAESLADMLKGQPQLRILNLNDTSLEDDGVSTIAAALVDAGMCLTLCMQSIIYVFVHGLSFMQPCSC